MKIARLDLRAFGRFDEKQPPLSFDSAPHGLHVIYGPNEAGKSTALRALKCLFYGIPHQTDDAFLHPHTKLRIGAALVRSDGARLECVRRKGNANTLRDGADDAPLGADALGGYLSGIDDAMFARMFAIDHRSLEEGGKELIHFGGELSSALVAAAGLTGIRSVQKKLEEEHDAIFAPRGSKREINKKLSDFRDAQQCVSKLQLSGAQWKRRQAELNQAKEELAAIEAELNAARTEKSHLERVLEAVPDVNLLRSATAQFEALGQVRILADDFSRRRGEQSQRLSGATSAIETISKALDELDRKIADLNVREEIVAQGDAIEDLQSDLGKYRSIQQKDLPGLIAERDQLRTEARRALAQLQHDHSLADVKSLCLTADEKLSIQGIGNRYEALLQPLNDAESKLKALAAKLGSRVVRHASTGGPRDAALLNGALRRLAGVLRLEDELIQANGELRRLNEDAAAELARLAPFEGPLSRLETLPVPSAETIDEFERRITEAERAVKEAAEQKSQAAFREAECLRDLEEVRLIGDVPSEGDLLNARQRRDRGWRLVHSHWHGCPAPVEEADFAAEFGLDGDLTRAFEAAVKAADDLADRLRHEAERVAKKANLVAQLQFCRTALEQQTRAQDEATSHRDGCFAEWRSAWQPSGIVPLPPRQMRVWHRQRDSLLNQIRAIRAQQTRVDTLSEQIDRYRRELDQAFTDLGEPARLSAETFAAQLERGDKLAAQIDLETQIVVERSHLNEAKHNLEQWTSQWSSAVARLALPSNATPSHANQRITELDALFGKLSDAEGLDRRIAQMEDFSQSFVARLTSIMTALGASANFESGSTVNLATRIANEYKAAMKEGERLAALCEERSRQTRQLEFHRAVAHEAQSILNLFCEEAACQSVDDLPVLEEASSEARRLKQTIAQCRDALTRRSGGMPLDEFIRHVAEFDQDTMPGRVEQVGALVVELDERRIELSNAVALQSKELAELGGSAAAAEAEQKVQSLTAEIAAGAEEYTKLKLASAILGRAVARYRENHQGPIIRRASELFAELTAGSFSGLRTDEDDKGRPVLLGVRASDGQVVSVNPGMSEGTADQLYLALRLATVETWLEGKEPFPFIVDDILIKFDNERSAATLRVLAELSRRTQVIFFTHHEHLVELARQNVEAEVLFVHELNARLPADILAAGPRLAR